MNVKTELKNENLMLEKYLQQPKGLRQASLPPPPPKLKILLGGGSVVWVLNGRSCGSYLISFVFTVLFEASSVHQIL